MLECDPYQMPGGAQIPTAFFRDPRAHTILEGDNKENQKLIGYKSLHYEHMREFIQNQEL